MPAKAMTILAVLFLSAAGGCSSAMGNLMRERPVLDHTPEEDVAAFNEAVQLTSSLRYNDAIEQFEAVLPRLRAVGDDDRSAEAMFWMGYCYEKLGHTDGAAQWYARVRAMYPKHRVAEQATGRQANLTRSPPPAGD